MIQAAGKYSSARAPVRRLAGGARSSPKGTVAKATVPDGHPGFNVWMKAASAMQPADFQAWWHRELKSGGSLSEYLRIEKARTTERYRRVARKEQDFQQNNQSEYRKVASVPARDYFRWLREDPHFFDDDSNLRSLKRDNPDARVYL